MSLESARSQGLLVEFDPLGAYVDQLRSMVDVEAIRKAGWNVVTDVMYGAGTGFFAAVLGDGIKELHGEQNPCFSGTQPEPIGKNLTELEDAVAHEGIDIGLATDGDADRIGAVDETGHFVDSHHIFALIMKHLIENRKMEGEVVKTISTTQMIDRVGEAYHVPVHQTAIGFKNISAKFLEIPAMIGGEESGGIAIVKHVCERDGILSGLILLEIMTHTKKSLGKLIRELEEQFGSHRFRRDDLDLEPSRMDELRNRIKEFSCEEIAGAKVTETLRLDGCRLSLEDGSWILVRPSGTEPLLRLYAEAESDQRVDELLGAIRKELSL